MENNIINTEEIEVRTKRAYTRRSKEEIEAEKKAKAERKAAREAKKKEKMEETMKKTETTEVEENVEKKTTKKKEKVSTTKNSNNQKVVMNTPGKFNDASDSIHKERMYVEIELMDSALGTSPSSKDLLAEYIASNAPDAPSREEEIAALGPERIIEKGTTIFPIGKFIKTKDGNHLIDILDNKEKVRFGITSKNIKEQDENSVRLPFYWNYQIRGMFKDSCGLLSRANYGNSAKLKAYKKVIDGGILVSPRRIAIEVPEEYYEYDRDGNLVTKTCDPTNLDVLSRPLLTSGPSGTNTAIARSEIIPTGSKIKFCIEYLDPSMKETIIEWLNYGIEHGLGAWRNSGHGTFVWREINPDYSVDDSDEE